MLYVREGYFSYELVPREKIGNSITILVFFSYKQKLATSSEATQPVRPPSSKRVRKKTCRWHSVVRFHDPYPLAVGVGRILLAILNDRV